MQVLCVLSVEIASQLTGSLSSWACDEPQAHTKMTSAFDLVLLQEMSTKDRAILKVWTLRVLVFFWGGGGGGVVMTFAELNLCIAFVHFQYSIFISVLTLGVFCLFFIC